MVNPQGTRAKSPSPVFRRHRSTRTILLATTAFALAMFWLARELDLDCDELLGYLSTSVLFVGTVVGLSMVGAGIVWLMKRAARARR
jgi:hypothetical protein